MPCFFARVAILFYLSKLLGYGIDLYWIMEKRYSFPEHAKYERFGITGDGGKVSSFHSATDPRCVIIVNKLRSFTVP